MRPTDPDNDRQFWVIVVAVGIVLVVGLTWFHRCFELGRSLSVDGLAMVGTTLIAAAAGFLAIVLQVRSSSRQLRYQMKAQRDGEREERERQKRSVATAILLEIDDFCMHVSGLCDVLFNQDLPESEKRAAFLKFVPLAFTVYPSIADKLGGTGVEATSAVVKFYNKANALNHYLQLCRSALARVKTVTLTNYEGSQGNQQILDHVAENENPLGDLSFAFGEAQQLFRELAELAGQARDALSSVASISLPGVNQLHLVVAKYAQTN